MTSIATKLVGDLYGCLLQDAPEMFALDLLCATVGASHAMMMRAGSCGPLITTSHHLASVASPQLAGIAGSEEYRHVLAGVPAGSVLRMTDLIPHTEIVRTDLYENMLRPLDGGLSTCGVHLDGSGMAITAICRSATRDTDFDDEAVGLLRIALPHLAMIAGIAERQRQDRRHAQSVFDALDGIDDGILILKVDGRLVHANAAADAMLVAGDRIRRTRDGVGAAYHNDDLRLQRAVRAAQDLDRSDSSAGVVTADKLHLTLRCDGTGWPLIATVMPAHRTTGTAPRGMVTIRLRDPGRRASLSNMALREEYGLTPREASLVEELAGNATLIQASSALSLSVGTARQYLKSVFQKTGVTSQAQLLRLIGL